MNRSYWKRWLQKAFVDAWVFATGGVATAVALGAPALGKWKPDWKPLTDDLAWQLPLVLLALTAVIRAGFAAYFLEREDNQALREQLRQALAAAEKARVALAAERELTNDYRNHKRIADTLLERYQAGNRLLKHPPYNVTVKHIEWIMEANRWMKETLEAMEAVGCTPHDINWVEPTGTFEPWKAGIMQVYGLLRDRVGRVGEVGKIYQERAEEAKKSNPITTGV